MTGWWDTTPVSREFLLNVAHIDGVILNSPLYPHQDVDLLQIYEESFKGEDPMEQDDLQYFEPEVTVENLDAVDKVRKLDLVI